MIKPFERFKKQCRGVVGLWGRYIAFTAIATALFGPFLPFTVPALILTIAAPILLLTLWGRSLDQELGWMDRRRGPW